jgi:hypothetical protein
MSIEHDKPTTDEYTNLTPLTRPQHLTRDNLIQRHELDDTDPSVCTLLDQIEALRDTAVVPDFVPIIAHKKIADFKRSRQSGNEATIQE